MKSETDIKVRKSSGSFTGIVVPIEWDEEGTPLAIAIATEDEQEYRIAETNRKGRALHQLLRKRVRVRGTVNFPAEGARAELLVSSFKILEDLP